MQLWPKMESNLPNAITWPRWIIYRRRKKSSSHSTRTGRGVRLSVNRLILNSYQALMRVPCTTGDSISLAIIRPAFKVAVQNAAQSHFGGGGRTGDENGRLIWCMEMSPRVLMGPEIGLRTVSERCIVRNSDDCGLCEFESGFLPLTTVPRKIIQMSQIRTDTISSRTREW